MVRNTLLSTVDLPLDYEIGLDITPGATVNILHVTATNSDCCHYGTRIPAVLFRPGSRRLHIVDGHEDYGNSNTGEWLGCTERDLTEDVTASLKIVVGAELVQVFLNNEMFCEQKRYNRRVWSNVKVYAAGPWHPAADPSIAGMYLDKPACVLKEEGRCVGSSSDYLNDEECTIHVRTWAETTPPSGNGALCPAAASCQPVEDLCPDDIDCVGSFSACTSVCERVEGRAWTQTVAPTGNGAACPLSARMDHTTVRWVMTPVPMASTVIRTSMIMTAATHTQGAASSAGGERIYNKTCT